MADLARLSQLQGESVKKYIARFRKLRTRCQTSLTEKECVSLALRGLNLNMGEKFEGKEFTDLFNLVTRAASYERLREEKKERRTSSKGTYYKDPSLEIAVADHSSPWVWLTLGTHRASLAQVQPHTPLFSRLKPDPLHG